MLGLLKSRQFPLAGMVSRYRPELPPLGPLIASQRLPRFAGGRPEDGHDGVTVNPALFGRFGHAPGQPGALFVPHLIEAETRADGDHVEYRV